MNYRHGFHAGNFADVFKHALLARLLVYLARKETPFRVIDTHAGEGLYDLAADEAQRTGEWREGIGRLSDLSAASDEARSLLAPFLNCVGPFKDGRPERYPGSPEIARRLMRAQDRAIFCELRPDAFAALRYRFANDARIKTVGIDGYVGVGAFVPPIERRGLVLIDPPFERKDEFDAMFAAFHVAYRKWPTGIYALWFPVKDAHATRAFWRRFAHADVRRLLRLELAVGGPQTQLNRAGLAVINAPYVFSQEARALAPFLTERLAQGIGSEFVIEEMAGE